MESGILETEKENVVRQAIGEGFITGKTAATDITHFEVCDQAPSKKEKPETEPKKRGRKPKEELKQWLKAQLDAPLAKLRVEVPQDPKWGVKKNSEGQNVFWFGYKAHLVVGTQANV